MLTFVGSYVRIRICDLYQGTIIYAYTFKCNDVGDSIVIIYYLTISANVNDIISVSHREITLRLI